MIEKFLANVADQADDLVHRSKAVHLTTHTVLDLRMAARAITGQTQSYRCPACPDCPAGEQDQCKHCRAVLLGGIRTRKVVPNDIALGWLILSKAQDRHAPCDECSSSTAERHAAPVAILRAAECAELALVCLGAHCEQGTMMLAGKYPCNVIIHTSPHQGRIEGALRAWDLIRLGCVQQEGTHQEPEERELMRRMIGQYRGEMTWLRGQK